MKLKFLYNKKVEFSYPIPKIFSMFHFYYLSISRETKGSAFRILSSIRKPGFRFPENSPAADDVFAIGTPMMLYRHFGSGYLAQSFFVGSPFHFLIYLVLFADPIVKRQSMDRGPSYSNIREGHDQSR
jgi:hypothetical protein